MKPAAVAATLLLHTASLGAFYHFGTEPAALKGQTSLSVTLLQGGNQNQPSAAHPALAKAAPRAADTSTLSGDSANATGSAVSIPADYAAANQKPVYPLLSRKQDEEGTVVLRILVKADGSPGEIHIHQSSGHPLLDESALSAVRQWRFHPASINRRPIAEWYQVAIPFKLQK